MTTTLSVRLNAEQNRRLATKAISLGVNKSEVIRQLVDAIEEKPMTWAEILKDVQAASKKIKKEDLQPNPVLEERKKWLKRYEHLR